MRYDALRYVSMRCDALRFVAMRCDALRCVSKLTSSRTSRQLGVGGAARAQIQVNLLRKYLNYTDASRKRVGLAGFIEARSGVIVWRGLIGGI